MMKKLPSYDGRFNFISDNDPVFLFVIKLLTFRLGYVMDDEKTVFLWWMISLYSSIE